MKNEFFWRVLIEKKVKTRKYTYEVFSSGNSFEIYRTNKYYPYTDTVVKSGIGNIEEMLDEEIKRRHERW